MWYNNGVDKGNKKMDVRHFLKIYNDDGTDVVRMIRSRSFDDVNFKRFYQGEQKFDLFSQFLEKIEFSANECLYLSNVSAFEHNYEIPSYEDQDNGARKARLVNENYELQLSSSEMGDFALAYGRYNFDSNDLRNQAVKFNKAILRNGNDEIIEEIEFNNGGMTLKEIVDYCNSIISVHKSQQHLSFVEITDQLLSGSDVQEFAKNYKNLTKILRKVEKFRNIKSKNVQLSLDSFLNANPSKQKGN